MEITQSEAYLYEVFKTCEQNIKQKFEDINPKKATYETLLNSPDLERIFDTSISLFKDLSFCLKKKIDKRLWDIVKEYIRLFNCVDIKEEYVIALNRFFDSKVALFQKILKFLLGHYHHIDNDQSLGDQPEKIIIANVCSHYAEILEKREKLKIHNKLKPDAKSIKITSNLYCKAANIYPYAGKFYLLLAELTSFNNDLFCSVYWCIRAQSCKQPHDCKKVLHQLFKKMADHQLLNSNHTEDYWQSIKVYAIEYFKEVYEGIKNIRIQELITYLRKAISETKASINIQQIYTLNFIIQMSLYAIYLTVEANNNQLKRSYYQLKEQYYYKNTIRNSFHIILVILELYNYADKERILIDLSILLIPTLVYLLEYPNIQRLVEEEFKDFESLILSIYRKYEKVNERTRLEYKVFDFEINLLGWNMFADYYKANRIQEAEKDEKVKPAYILYAVKNLDYINIRNIKATYTDIRIKVVEEVKRDKQSSKQKTLIVVDGRNVAIQHGEHQFFSSRGLDILVKYWRIKDYPVIIILPDYCFDEVEIDKRRSEGRKQKTIPDNVGLLKKLKKEGYAVGVPNRDYEDSYIIEYARSKKAYIITNDHFNDHKNHEKLNSKQKEQLREYLRHHSMSFVFIKDEFYPNPDFLKKNNML